MLGDSSLLLLALAASVVSLQLPTRRQVGGAALSSLVVAGPPAFARDEQLTRIGQEAPVLNPDDVPFTELASGVKVKSLRAGIGGETVGRTSAVSVECTGRLLNLNGVSFYSTKNLPGAKELGGTETVAGVRLAGVTSTAGDDVAIRVGGGARGLHRRQQQR